MGGEVVMVDTGWWVRGCESEFVNVNIIVHIHFFGVFM